jgi:hypothetical protein
MIDARPGRTLVVRPTAHAHRNVALLWLVVAGLAGLVALNGCGHAHGVEHPAAAGTEATGGGTSEKQPNAKPPADHPDRVAGARADKKTEKPDAKDVPLATSRAGLLESGAAEKIQERLVALGFLDESKKTGAIDEPTGAALKKFQQSRDMVVTGAADQETVKKLDLDPKAIFRSATP